jgi:putative addiction module component (TIGR02574 family)
MSLPSDLKTLSPADRIALVDALLDSLSDQDWELTPAQQAELTRRLEMFDQDRAAAVPWETVRSALRPGE